MKMGWVVLLGGLLAVGCGGPLTEEPSLGLKPREASEPGQDDGSAEWSRP
ncbi:hypothetical protein [Cystobacter fuscus]